MRKGGIENDFVFNNNVAGAGKMIRMGKSNLYLRLIFDNKPYLEVFIVGTFFVTMSRCVFI